MPPQVNSRYARTTAVQDSAGRLYLTPRERYLYRELPDNRRRTITQGDTLWGLAAKFYGDLSDPPRFSAAELWWVIADFQPRPIHDPTIELQPGHILVIPSLRTVQERVLGGRP